MFILVKSRDGRTEHLACLTSTAMIDELFMSLEENMTVTIYKDD